MDKTLVYDLPTRAFHWVFAALFVLSFTIGKVVDDDSSLYAYHMISGILMSALVVLRVAWGAMGTKYARFIHFNLSPIELKKYFLGILKNDSKRELGHNPASSFAAILMFILTFCLLGTGLLMVTGTFKEFFEEVHELLAHGFLLIVLLHITGVILHQLRHNDGMISSMLDGQKESIEGEEGIKSRSPIALVTFLISIFYFSATLIKSFDQEKGTLILFGYSLQLGEKENEHSLQYYNDYYDDEEYDD